MKPKLVKGNIFDTGCQWIGHGVNCVGVMGAGIALQVRRRYPYSFTVYQQVIHDTGLVPGQNIYVVENPHSICHMATQPRPGRFACLELVEMCISEFIQEYNEVGVSLALPRIGCGIGGLNWEDVSQLLEKLFTPTAIEVEFWTYML